MLSFASPVFLWGLLALAAPVIVHLINRERAVMKEFPSTRFIDPSRLPQQGRRRLRDYWLLALRMLVYAGVVLALASPRWVSPGDQAPLAGDTPSAVFVVDASASMSQRGMDGRLRAALEQFVQGLPAATRIGAVVYDDQVRLSLPPTRDRGMLLDAITDADRPRNRAGQPSVGLAEAARLLNGRAGKVIVFSDFQASDWQSSAAPRLPVGTELELVSLRSEPERNVGIQSVSVFPSRDGSLRIFVRVRNDWNEAVPVTLSLAETNVSLEAELAPNATELLALRVPANKAPEKGVPARLDLTVRSDESWPDQNLYLGDDSYHFWLGGKAGLLIGAMIPTDEEPQKLREASFVARALEVGDETASQRFEFVPVRGEGWEESVDVLYLPAVGAYFDEALWGQVRAFVEGGGVLLVTPGKATPRLLRGMRESGVSGTAYVGRARRADKVGESYRIGELPPSGPLAPVFDDDARQDLYLAEVYEFWRVNPAREAEIILATEGGDPLILRERLGDGVVILSTFEFDPLATDLPLRNSFVPVLWELLSQSVSRTDQTPSIAVGEAVPGAMMPDSLGGAIDTSAPAVIQVGGQPLEINVARSESIPQGAVLADVRGRVLASSQGVAPCGPAGEDQPGTPLWPWLAALALLACLIESVLAQRVETPTHATA